MKPTFLLAALAGVSLMAGAASAQDFSQSPTSGQARLSAGFTPDPHRVSLIAGGSRDASNLPGSCVGMVANAPDYRLHYSANSQWSLGFIVQSSADTTLVINGPDGRWYCDDDGAGDLNPLVYFITPQSGQYDIWVGTFGSGGAPATLLISED